jgi:hypothetical protein
MGDLINFHPMKGICDCLRCCFSYCYPPASPVAESPQEYDVDQPADSPNFTPAPSHPPSPKEVDVDRAEPKRHYGSVSEEGSIQ